MARNQLAVVGKKGKNFRDIQTVVQNPSDRSKLQNYIDEAVRCKQHILDHQESIKTLRDSAINELGIEPKIFSTLVTLFFNNNFDEKKAEIEKIESAIDALMSIQAISSRLPSTPSATDNS